MARTREKIAAALLAAALILPLAACGGENADTQANPEKLPPAGNGAETTDEPKDTALPEPPADTRTPVRVEELAGERVSATELTVTWTACPEAAAYIVMRREDGVWRERGRVEAGQEPVFTDTLDDGEIAQYFYRVDVVCAGEGSFTGEPGAVPRKAPTGGA